jgi:hypothetical protein
MPLAARARSSMMRLSNCMIRVWEALPALATLSALAAPPARVPHCAAARARL